MLQDTDLCIIVISVVLECADTIKEQKYVNTHPVGLQFKEANSIYIYIYSYIYTSN